MRNKPRVSEWFVRIRLLCVHILYFVLLYAICILLFVYFAPIAEEQPSELSFDTCTADCTYVVKALVPVRDMENKAAVRVELSEGHRRLSVIVYDKSKIEGITEGTEYIGYKYTYKAFADEELVLTHINDLFYLHEATTTLTEFKAQAEDIWRDKHISAYNIRYRGTFFIYCAVSFFVLLLFVFIAYKNRMRKYRYRVLQNYKGVV